STASAASPSARASTASASLQDRVNAGGKPLPPADAGSPASRARKARHAARPSRPQPHSATRSPRSEAMSVGESRTQALPQRRRNAVFVVGHQQGLDARLAGAELWRDLAREARHDRV